MERGSDDLTCAWVETEYHPDVPISWDGRVVYATPLHLAVTADKDHPDYRAATSQEADDETEEISLADARSRRLPVWPTWRLSRQRCVWWG